MCMAMWRGERVQYYHVSMREPLLACGALAWDKVDAGNGAMEQR